MKRAVHIVLFLLLALPCAAFGAAMTVTPLDDEFEGKSAPLHTPPGPRTQGDVPSSVDGTGVAPSAVSTGSAHSPQGSLTPGGGEGKDALVVAYLIDLARKQNKPCPSGATLPVPPSLAFSEPLCKAAEAAARGMEPGAAITEQGLYAVKWRMFSAADAPAQRVVNGLRNAHCEALLEPYTHIGASRDSGGWRIILATITDKPEGGETGNDPGSEPGGQPVTGPGIVAGTAPAAAAGTGVAEAGALPGESTANAALGGNAVPKNETAAINGQEARTLFLLLNELRAKGGVCFGKEMPPTPALVFNSELQTVAEKDLQPDSGGVSPGAGGMLYRGSNMTKLTLKADSHASVALDVWMVSPSQCETLLSPMFTDVGAAYEGGRWMLVLGGMNAGVPSDK
ncbi:MAG: hypothetical protein DELT_00948 [Desulfovibrio sp.]